MEQKQLNLEPNQVFYPPILYVTKEHIMKLLGKGKSTANDHLSVMRKRYHIVKPSKVTIDIACDYFTLNKDQFYRKVYDIGVIYQFKIN